MRDRPDFNEALTTLIRLHQESGQERLAPIPYWQNQTWDSSSSSSSTSWWQWNDSWWSSCQLTPSQTASQLMKEQHIERGDPFVPFLPNTVRSETLQFFLQLTECVNSTPHVTFSHFFTLIYTHMRGSRHSLACAHHIP